jgi:hypothetical protein
MSPLGTSRRSRHFPDLVAIAATLTGRLREVTDEFLIFQNRDRPDVLEQITGPSIMPDPGE